MTSLVCQRNVEKRRLISEVRIIPKENVFYNKKSRLYEVKK